MSVWQGRNEPFVQDPLDACNAAFGFGAPEEDEAGPRRALIVDRVLEDYRATRDSTRISSEGRRQLDHYMDLIRDLQSRLGAELDRRVALSCDELSAPDDDDNETRQNLYIDVMVAALASGATRIASWKPAGYRDRSLDFDHSDVHARRAPWRTMITWQYEMVARFLTRLDAVVEADGRTLLDHCLVLASSNMGVPSHGVEGMPTVIAGNDELVRLGELIDYRRMEHPELRGRPYNELLITLFHAHGLGPSDYQQEGRRGFGVYRNETEYGEFYSARDRPLPHFWRS